MIKILSILLTGLLGLGTYCSPSNASTFAVEGCRVSLKVQDIRHPVILGQGFIGESEDTDLILRPIQIEKNSELCQDYIDISSIEMNNVGAQIPQLLELKKGDVIDGGLMPLVPNPRGKILMNEYHHRFRIHYTLKNNLTTADEPIYLFKYFDYVGVFKD